MGIVRKRNSPRRIVRLIGDTKVVLVSSKSNMFRGNRSGLPDVLGVKVHTQFRIMGYSVQ